MTSVENQEYASRIPLLLSVPAKYYALSIEPLLGPVELKPEWLKQIDWIIVGGESGHDVRPTHPDWIRSLRDQCAQAGVHFFFKQWGVWSSDHDLCNEDLSNVAAFAPGAIEPVYLANLPPGERRAVMDDPAMTLVYKSTKHEAGNFLDGRRHLDHPFDQPIEDEIIVTPLSVPVAAKPATPVLDRVRQLAGTHKS
jgi:hypothetical protein